MLEIVDVLSASWKPRFVVPAPGHYSAALESAKYAFDIAGGHGLVSVAHLASIIRERRVSLVHANLQWAVPLVAASSRLVGVPFIAHLRNMVTDDFAAQSKEFFRHASAIICISRAVRESARATGLLFPEQEDRIFIISDGRNLANYRHGDRGRIRAELGIGEDVPLVGMVARIEPVKGQHTFLETAALVAEHVPSARFLLVGDIMHVENREYLQMLQRRCDDPRLKQRVTFFGYRKDIPDILAALDCFVHPSARGAFVSVLIEAMAAGVPLVVPAVDGIPECVGRDGAAALIYNLQPEDFANAIMQILGTPARRASMSLAGRERAKRYDAALLARATERAFESCFDGVEQAPCAT